MNPPQILSIKSGLVIFAIAQLIFVFASSAVAQERNGSSSQSLVGRWQSSDSIMEIRADGTMTLNGKQYSYKTANSALVISNNDKTVNFPFELSGDYLTITLSSQRIMYRRVAGSSSGDSKNNNDEIFSGNSRQNNDSSEIFGQWKSEDQTTLDISRDGTLTINGTPYSYKSSGSALSVSNGKGGAANFPFQLVGGELIVTIQGKRVPFRRVGAGSVNNRNNDAVDEGDRSTGLQRQKSGASSGLIGRWKSDKGILEFSDKGIMTINGEQVAYKVNGSAIAVSSPQGSLNFPFQLSGDQLIMGASGRQVVYTRIGAGGNSSGSNLDANDESEASFDNRQPKNSGIIGRWQSDEATLDIRSNGTITINGEQYSYKVSGSTIRVSGNEGSMDFPFQLLGDKMVVSVQGRRVTYTRITGNSAETGRQTNNRGGVLQELVGKWCYYGSARPNSSNMRTSESCITLNADGTFTYFENNHTAGPPGAYTSDTRDAGRWSATANSITSQSNSTGTNTFRLEKRNHPKNGDPMIVLDGKEFVTAYKRAPW